MVANLKLDDIHVSGLTEQEAADRLTREGFNELPSARQRNIFAIALNVVREPMLLLLLGAGATYMVLGDIGEALILLSFVFVIIGITLYQERKTERTLEALRDLSSPRALVIRDGIAKRIPGREVARGDAVVLAEGDRVPADGVIISATNLMLEESLLTGESVPVHKSEGEGVTEMGPPGGENTPFVFSGTLVVGGVGVTRVVGTGIHTEFGTIGKSLQKIEQEDTLLQKETRHIVRNLAFIGGALCLILFIIYGLTIGDWLKGLLAAITLAMAILPEEFPVVLAVFLALGAWRISRSHVLTRRMPAIEMLGADTVLCVDKTGTLTQNRMTVSEIFANGQVFQIDFTAKEAPPENFHKMIEFSILAGQKNPYDPMEKALKELSVRYHTLTEHLHDDWTLMKEYPLSKKLMALSRVWKSPAGDE